MKKQDKVRKKIKSIWNILHLADKCLLVFMMILLFQSAHTLFCPQLTGQESNPLDIIIRTTAAAIFGYFISANFQNGGQEQPAAQQPPEQIAAPGQNASPREPKPQPPAGGTALAPFFSPPRGEIGFTNKPPHPAHGAGEPGTLETSFKTAPDTPPPPPEKCNQFQILVVAAIGIFALLVLIIANDAFPASRSATATMSQLRDFVSGSVGFLIGHSTHQPPAAEKKR